MAVNVPSWSKERQYEWCLSVAWGKMCSSGTCETFSQNCRSLAKLGIICPTFDEYDIARIVPLYMAKYPEHRGYEERLKWILRCLFSGRVEAIPPGATKVAPYVPRTTSPAQTPTRPALPGPQPETPKPAVPTWLKIAALAVVAYLVVAKR